MYTLNRPYARIMIFFFCWSAVTVHLNFSPVYLKPEVGACDQILFKSFKMRSGFLHIFRLILLKTRCRLV